MYTSSYIIFLKQKTFKTLLRKFDKWIEFLIIKMDKLPFESGANYYEIHIKPSLILQERDELASADVSLTGKQFLDLLVAMKNSNESYKFFQKEYKEYQYTDLVVQNYKNTETRVFRQNFVTMNQGKNWLLTGYQRSKLTFLSVPSTTNIHDMMYVKRLIFRVNNRVYVNFQTSLHQDGAKTYQVYINYNHENNVDQEGLMNTLNNVLSVLV